MNPLRSFPESNQMSFQNFVKHMKLDASRQEQLMTTIVEILEETVLRFDSQKKQSSLPSFTGSIIHLTPSGLVGRMVKFSGASPCCYLVGLIYLEKMKSRNQSLYLTSSNFLRLFLTSTMTAAKYLDDFYYDNKHWSEIGAISVQEINRLELEFLFRMDFRLHIQREEYDWYVKELELKMGKAKPSNHAPLTFEYQQKALPHKIYVSSEKEIQAPQALRSSCEYTAIVSNNDDETRPAYSNPRATRKLMV